MRRLRFSVAVTLGLVFSILWKTNTVLAHESVIVGPYQLEIGWLNEPALAAEKNAVWISAVNAETGQPVADIATVKVSISTGGRRKDLLLRPLAADQPGQYVADLIPTVRGVYTLQLQGTLVEERVDVSIDLDEVEPASDWQFPELAPSPVELQKRLATAEAALAFTRTIAFIALAASLLTVFVSLIRGNTKPS
jgi:hypothetical protein